MARNELIVGEYYNKSMSNSVWFDGYTNQRNVLLEDVPLGFPDIGYLLKIWLDNYSFMCETKGGSVMCTADRIVITSNYDLA